MKPSIRMTWLCLVALIIGGCATGGSRPVDDSHGGSHRYKQSGNGSPVVVFESGLGDTMEPWTRVLTKVDKFALTFAYNRAGYSGSPASTAPRDAAHIVTELRELLKSRNLQPPYVLVGHSLGGLYMQYYARNFPDEVAGLVLVDSTHWDQSERMRSETPALARLLQGLSHTMPGGAPSEFAAMEATQRQVKESPPLRPMPFVVLSATQRIPLLQPLRAALEAPFAKHLDQMQKELAAQLPTAHHVLAERSDHYIQRSQPELVVAAVQEVIAQTSVAPSKQDDE